MNLTNLIKVAVTAIMSNKWRTFLSTLGIIIGVAAVITMMAIGQGSKDSIRADLQKWGTNLLTVRPGGEMRGGVRLDPSAMQTLKQADYEAIRDGASLITHISPEVTSGGQVIYGAKNTNSTIYGESPDYMIIKLWDIESGQCFTEEDVRKNAKVCVVGKTVVQELFGDKNANCVGKVIRFKSIPFRIIGILKGKGYNNWGMDQDNVIIAPYTTVMKRLAAQTHFNSLNLNVIPEEYQIGECRLTGSVTGRYGPGSSYAAISRALPASASCAVFGYANGGNGDYVQVECYDNGLSQYRRAWVPVSMVSGLILY